MKDKSHLKDLALSDRLRAWAGLVQNYNLFTKSHRDQLTADLMEASEIEVTSDPDPEDDVVPIPPEDPFLREPAIFGASPLESTIRGEALSKGLKRLRKSHRIRPVEMAHPSMETTIPVIPISPITPSNFDVSSVVGVKRKRRESV